MKYYKLLTKLGYNGDCFIIGKIYQESYREKGGANSVKFMSEMYPNDLQEVTPGEYFVQEGKMPEYFTIKRVEGNPLWEKYICWLNKEYSTSWSGNIDHCFYGFGKDKITHGACASIKNFGEDAVNLTLEQWDKIINKTIEEEFKLQKIWFIQLTEENKDLIEKWHRKICMVEKVYDIGSFYGVFSDGTGDAWNYNSLPKNTQVITTEQFIKYVLNKEVMKEDKEIIGWKLKEDFKKYEKACISISKLSVYPELRGYYCIGKNAASIDNFKKAEVLELWFNPVYKEKTLKFGGYDVTFEKVTSGVRISCNGETGTFSQIQAIYNYFKPNSINFKFGSQEVRKVIYDKKEWDIAPDDDKPTSIKIGCTTGEWKEFVAIYEEAKSML